MLGWMLKRGENAQEADAGDTTQLDQPDTPAPVFAARAFKSALFGTPAPPSNESRNKRRDKRASQRADTQLEKGSGTPSRPGILLTPGTGAARRKRVSFGNHIPETANPGVSKPSAAADDRGHTSHADSSGKSRPESSGAEPAPVDSEGEWEEADDDDYCAHDITVDLNEPHSQSGRYWKEEFEKYHREAKAEMEKLLKYKQLAKSYAREKDAEAIQLAERLRDEQQKVIDMEKKIAENASQIVSNNRQSSDADASESLSKLTKQTALAAQYRHRVQELEDELGELVGQKEGAAEGKARHRRSNATSPTTQKTLVETQRELRRARTQLRELDGLRQEVSSLKARVKTAEAQAKEHERDRAGSSAEAKIRNLKAQLEQSREESRKKSDEMRQLQGEFDAFRKESATHEADTKAVLERAHAKISDLKKEVKMLRSAGPDPSRPGVRQIPSAGQGSDSKGAEPKHPVRDTSAPSTRVQEQTRGEANDAAQGAPIALTERTNLGKPRWQPFVPRSPRNRAYLGDAAAAQPKDMIAAPALPAMGRAATRIDGAGGDGEVDLLQGRFARVGGPVTDRRLGSSSLGKAAKSSALPPERRAAALARIEKRLAEKKRAPRRAGSDKENMRP